MPMRSFWLGLFAFICACSAAQAVADRELEAKQSADAWLVYLDEGKYTEALTLCAPELRQSVRPNEWSEGLKEVRAPLGTVKQRRLQRLFATNVLPGNIEGDFVVVNYRTEFTGREGAVEEILILTPGKATEGEADPWLVTSYYLE